MRSPVNFISFEKELQPIATFFKGRVLNAGCGNRDLSEIFKSWGAKEVENCDIKTSISGSFSCDLHKIPREDCAYDTILCNAVLEHVANPVQVINELARLLKPGGHLLLSVPFLQPFHPCPSDYQRYTRMGLELLAQNAGFTILQINPIHSLAQTIGWILWSHLEESKNYLGKILFFIPIYLSTRFFREAPKAQFYQGNTFQAVLIKKALT